MFTCMLFIKKKKGYLYATASKLKERERKKKKKKEGKKYVYFISSRSLFPHPRCLVFSTIKGSGSPPIKKSLIPSHFYSDERHLSSTKSNDKNQATLNTFISQ